MRAYGRPEELAVRDGFAPIRPLAIDDLIDFLITANQPGPGTRADRLLKLLTDAGHVLPDKRGE